MARGSIELEVAGRTLVLSNPARVVFPHAGYTKLDLVRYYLAVAPAALRAVLGRPLVLKRYVHGESGPAFYQKRAPERRPAWVEAVELSFPSGRTACEIVARDAAALIYTVQLGCIELHAHPVRADDLDHPDELRVDLDPGPGVGWKSVTQVALVAREVLADHGLVGFPKTSGSRGMHVYVRIERRHGFREVRRAAVAVAREVERRAPELATSRWWKEERHGVFLDYNQNAKDRTMAAAYSVRPTPDARVSTPLAWDEVARCDPAEFTLATVPERLSRRGDPAEGLDEEAFPLEGLLELAARQEREGLGEAPWPPHYEKAAGEPPRVQPSRRAGRGRRAKAPLVVVARAPREADALLGLERWKERHPEAASHLAPEDVLVDSMRGRSSTWTRVRVNLRRVPEPARPAVEEAPDPDFDPRLAA